MADRYDVIIVGAGPAGIFAALELVERGGLDVLMIEKGRALDQRICPISDRSPHCALCPTCAMVSGWGGAGAYSDGKLTLSAVVGGRLPEYLGAPRANELIAYADDIYRRFGAPSQVYGTGDTIAALQRRASLAELRLVPVPIRHLGTEHCEEVLRAMHAHLAPRLDLQLRSAAARILVEDGRVQGIETADGRRFACQYLIVAPGREGADWLAGEARRLQLTLKNNPVDLGVRVEVPAAVMEELTASLYESKLEYYSRTFDDRVRTFCVCPYGEVTIECTAGQDPVITVNGHSYADRKTPNTNFALLVSTTFTEPFRDPIAYGRSIARLANVLSRGVIIQRLGDLLEGRRSTPERIGRGTVEPTLKGATPGDLSFVLPYRHLKDLLEMLEAMDKLAPGVASRHTLLYGVEVKFYSSRLELTDTLESEVGNLFAVGDGAGVTRGLAQASASGLVAAQEVLRRLGKVDS